MVHVSHGLGKGIRMPASRGNWPAAASSSDIQCGQRRARLLAKCRIGDRGGLACSAIDANWAGWIQGTCADCAAGPTALYMQPGVLTPRSGRRRLGGISKANAWRAAI